MGIWSWLFPSREEQISRARELIERGELDTARSLLVGIKGEEAERLYEHAQKLNARAESAKGVPGECGIGTLTEDRRGQISSALGFRSDWLSVQLFAGSRLGRLSGASIELSTTRQLVRRRGPIVKRKIADELFAVLFASLDSVDAPLAPENLTTDFAGASESELFAFALDNSLARLDRASTEDGQIFRGTHASTFAFRIEQLVEQRDDRGVLLMIPTQNIVAAIAVAPGLSLSALDAFVDHVRRVAPTLEATTKARTELERGAFLRGAEPVSEKLYYKREPFWTVVPTDDRGVIRDRIPSVLRDALNTAK